MLQQAGETTRSTASSTQAVHQTGQRARTSSGRSELDWPGMGTSPHSIRRLRNTMPTAPSFHGSARLKWWKHIIKMFKKTAQLNLSILRSTVGLYMPEPPVDCGIKN